MTNCVIIFLACFINLKFFQYCLYDNETDGILSREKLAWGNITQADIVWRDIGRGI